ncbi:MAG: serine hydrolase [Thermomicrobiales bacterium]
MCPAAPTGYEPLENDAGGDGWRISNPIFDTTGATSLHTTVEDLLRWDRYLASWLANPSNEELTRPAILNDGEKTSYACGLTYGEIGEMETIGHSGSDAGYRAHYLRVPERDTAVAILCNASTMSPGELAEQVLAIVLEMELNEAKGANGKRRICRKKRSIA